MLQSVGHCVRSRTHARTTNAPFFGSCGGYQHAVLEVARNLLGLTDADNTEVNPDTAMPLICGLSCSLVEVHAPVRLVEGSQIATISGSVELDAAYHCSFGVNREFLPRFVDGPIVFTGFDSDGDPRAFEHPSHPFFIGTAFQPERAALDGSPHPVVSAFVAACELHHTSRASR